MSAPKPKLVPVEGLSMKIRTAVDERGQHWLTATVWIDGKPTAEVVRVLLAFIGQPNGPGHRAMQDAIIAAWREFLLARSGEPGIGVLECEPDYTGEPDDPAPDGAGGGA